VPDTHLQYYIPKRFFKTKTTNSFEDAIPTVMVPTLKKKYKMTYKFRVQITNYKYKCKYKRYRYKYEGTSYLKYKYK
jgi:hypothetical protein